MNDTPAAAHQPALARLVISVDELDRALRFYRDLLGLDERHRAGELAWLATRDGVEVMLHRRRCTPSDTAVAAGFLVDDVDENVRRWQDANGVVVDAPAERPWGERMAVVRDADGHLVCLSSSPATDATSPQ